MIGMAEKESEARGAHGEQKSRHKLRRAYWEKTLDAMKEANITIYQNISPSKDHWLSAGCGMSGCHYALIFGKAELRVELTLSRADAADNKWLFDQLFERRAEIESKFGHEIDWRRLDEKKGSRLQYGVPCDGYDREAWDEHVAWHIVHIRKLEAALRVPLSELNTALKARPS